MRYPSLKAHSVFKLILWGGISYACFPLDKVWAQTGDPGKDAHVHVTKKKSSTKIIKQDRPPVHQTAPANTPSIQAASHSPQIPSARNTSHPDTSRANEISQLPPNRAAESIVVTGTRLSQSKLTNVMAGTTVDAKQLRARGYTDLGVALLRENTSFSIGDNTPIGSQNAFGAGQSFAALLNLGSQRTLTLVDGLRMVGGETASLSGNGSGSQVDVSAIPTSLVKTIDTRLGGAGAAYGADAVAGVVNYVLDDHFTGVDFNAQGNWSQKLDAPSEKITFKYGKSFDHDKGGIVFDVEYRNSGGMLNNDRRYITGDQATWYSRPAIGSTTPYARVLTKSPRDLTASVTGIPQLTGQDVPVSFGVLADGVGNAAGQALMFDRSGQSLIPLTYDYATKSGENASGGNGLSLSDYGQLYAPTSKLNLTLLGHYDLTDHLHATWQGWYARGQASSLVAQGTWNEPDFDSPLTLESYHNNANVNGAYVLSTNNPYLSTQTRNTIKSALNAAGLPDDTFYLARLNQDLDSGMYQTTMQMFRFQGGLNGDFDAVGRNFQWSVKGEYSRYLNDTWQPMIVTQNLINALNATTDSSGNIVCAAGYTSASIKTRSSACSPLNPFGYDQMTPAAKDYVTADANSRNVNTQRDLQAEIHSTVVRLPAGDVRWDLGYEHRREGFNFDPGAFYEGWNQTDGSVLQYGNQAVLHPIHGHYQTHEVFGELDVPLISPQMHIPGAYSLSATANGRYTNNSMTGGYWTYMFGGAWWLTQDIGLSGNYARSVRNPSVTELFSPQTTTYNGGTDPCSVDGTGSGPNPAIRAANCAKAGIPSSFESRFDSQTVKGTTGGNSNLQNETSTSFTGSLEFAPHFIRGFDFRGSFVDVKINNAIESLSATDVLDACYDSSSYPNNSYCGAFTRDAAHQITSFKSGFYNIASYETKALQANIEYTTALTRFGLPSNSGTINLRGNYTHYLESQDSYLGNTYLLGGSTGSPNNLFTLNANYTRGPLSLQWQTIWYGSSHYALQVSDTAYEHNHRPSFAYFNLTAGYQITKNFDANFMVNNITNALPKYPGTVSLTRYYEAVIGRSFQLNLGAHF